MIKLRVVRYLPDLDAYFCLDEQGREHRVDLLVDGGLGGVNPREALIGRTVEALSLTPFLELANEVRWAE